MLTIHIFNISESSGPILTKLMNLGTRDSKVVQIGWGGGGKNVAKTVKLGQTSSPKLKCLELNHLDI